MVESVGSIPTEVIPLYHKHHIASGARAAAPALAAVLYFDAAPAVPARGAAACPWGPHRATRNQCPRWDGRRGGTTTT